MIKMKILVIVNSSEGFINFRGLLLEELFKRKHEIACIVPSKDNFSKADEKLIKMGCKLYFADIERRGMNPLKDFKLMLQYGKILRIWKPELVITYTIKPNIYGGIICSLIGIPYIENITGLGSAFEKKGLLKNIVVIMYKIALKKAKMVFFENVENRDIMVRYKTVRLNKTHVLAGAGVDLERFSYLEYPQEDKMTRFLFIGRVMKEKGIDELFKALEKLNCKAMCCSVDILGGFEEDYLEIFHKYEEKGWIKYHGIQVDIRPFILQSHCFVLPSWHEGMANVNLENAASGRPVITSRIHGCLEAVIDGKTGYLCESRNANSLYEAMKKFMELPYEQRKQMGIEGRKHMEKVFDKRKVVEETINMINRSLKY